jgi:23S rRNA pseudouridine1911/1915/1917 synthase
MVDRTPESFEVPEALAGERADKIVAAMGDMSRSMARALVDAGEVIGAEGRLDAKTRLEKGDVIAFPPAVAAEELVPEDVEFDVVYVDDDLIVVDKPSGLVVHPGAGRTSGTLAGGLLARFPELEGVGQANRWGIVHRLDRATSGLLVVARTTRSYDALSRAIRRRTISREYLAGTQGTFPIPRGTIDAPIGRDPQRPMRRAMVPEGRRAVTHYRLRDQWDPPGVALLDVRLETGRTHQIRVHLAGIGHAVLGDTTYGARDPIRVPRLFLHATRLTFEHPISGEEATFESELPADLRGVIEGLG